MSQSDDRELDGCQHGDSTHPKQSGSRLRIDALQRTLSDPELLKDTSLDAHRDMLEAAADSANGSAGDIRALSKTVTCIAKVITQDRLRADDRIRDIVAEVHKESCLFTLRPDIAHKLLEGGACPGGHTGEQASAPANGVTFKWLGINATANGKAALIVAGAVAVLIVFGGFVWWQDSRVEKAVTKAAATAARSAAAEIVGMSIEGKEHGL